ncbi:MAG: hypothetical protein IH949_12720 [Bacteroidetes bacterium]|nr:hypothetical protein [Bacteroidota bacterium]
MEKIVFGPTGPKSHATIHLGTKSKCLDVHITTEEIPPIHETVFKIEYSTLFDLLNSIKNNIDLLTSVCQFYSNYINLGKLKRHNSYIISVENESIIGALFKINKKQTGFKTKKDFNNSDILNLLHPVDTFKFESDKYALFKLKKNSFCYSGLLFNLGNKKAPRRFIFLSKKKLNELSKTVVNFVLDMLKDMDTNAHNSLKQFYSQQS